MENALISFNDILQKNSIDPREVLVFRHASGKPKLQKFLLKIAADHLNLLNAYQAAQGPILEKAMTRAKYIASCIGYEPGKAMFVDFRSIAGWKSIAMKKFWQIPEIVELEKEYGGRDFLEERPPRASRLWFDLRPTESYANYKGKLIINFPGLERAWWHRAHKNNFTVHAILEDSGLIQPLPDWKDMDFTWKELGTLPRKWEEALSHWRAIHYIFDNSDGKGSVGSAYDEEMEELRCIRARTK